MFVLAPPLLQDVGQVPALGKGGGLPAKQASGTLHHPHAHTGQRCSIRLEEAADLPPVSAATCAAVVGAGRGPAAAALLRTEPRSTLVDNCLLQELAEPARSRDLGRHEAGALELECFDVAELLEVLEHARQNHNFRCGKRNLVVVLPPPLLYEVCELLPLRD